MDDGRRRRGRCPQDDRSWRHRTGHPADPEVMHPQQFPGPHLRRLADAQEGYLTAGQAASLGLGSKAAGRLVRQGQWDRPARGLYDLRPGQDSLDRRVWSAVLQAGDHSAVGGAAALYLLGMDTTTGPVEVWVPDDRRPRPVTAAVIRRDGGGRLGRARGLPARICAEDALIDVCGPLRVDEAVARLTDALRLRLTTTDRLAARLQDRARVPGRQLLVAVIEDLDGVESSLEWAYRRDVERAHRLPQARRQVSVSRGSRSDGFYEVYGVIVELDGRRGHEDAGSSFRDLRRDNGHSARGMLTLRYGSADVRGRPCEVARQVWEALAGRGYPEPFHPCPRCRTAWWSVADRHGQQQSSQSGAGSR